MSADSKLWPCDTHEFMWQGWHIDSRGEQVAVYGTLFDCIEAARPPFDNWTFETDSKGQQYLKGQS